ncbi:hypothetical protein PQQ87_08520 [Paraburkholderia nemoris]|uniref:hypothetical protein n=1 Tax=Paraburkholderia nemoris TaxID=2793076 RepID=UPI0038BB91E7
MKIPRFHPPTLTELRAWWRSRDERDVQRLILEVQRQRLTLLELQNLIDRGVIQARSIDRSLVGDGEPLMRLRIRIAQEVLRVGVIDDAQKEQGDPRVHTYQRSQDALDYESEGRRKRRMRNM